MKYRAEVPYTYFLVSETLFQRRWFPYSPWNICYTLECAADDECVTEMMLMMVGLPHMEPCSYVPSGPARACAVCVVHCCISVSSSVGTLNEYLLNQ